MAVYPKSFTTNNFIPQSDGRFMATIFATTHKLGTNYHVAKMVRRDGDMTWHNMLGTNLVLTSDEAFEGYVILV